MLSIAWCLLASFGTLLYALWTLDFSVAVVARTAHALLPDFFRVTAAWGQHEGSLLLWVLLYSLVLAGWQFRFRRSFPEIPGRLILTMETILLAVLAGMLTVVLWYANPLQRIFPVPTEGMGFNPLLQDVALAIHPPILYLGMVLTSVFYAWSVARGWHGGTRLPSEWWPLDRVMLGWIRGSLLWLTFGIALGSWWAYRELGWGGAWFWDPVEVIALLPWLGVLALWHSGLSGSSLARPNFAMALGVPFLCILWGLALIRGGWIVSVHSFASDAGRGLSLSLVAAMASVVWLGGWIRSWWVSRSHKESSSQGNAVIDASLVLSWIAWVSVGVSLLSLLFPWVAYALYGRQAEVGVAFFAWTLYPLWCIACLVLAWRHGTGGARVVWWCLIPALGILWAMALGREVIAMGMLGLAALAIPVSLGYRVFHGGASLSYVMAHGGMAWVILGSAINGVWGEDYLWSARVGDREWVPRVGALHYVEQKREQGPNYVARFSCISIQRNPHETAPPLVLCPEERWYPAEDQVTVEASRGRMGFVGEALLMATTPGRDTPTSWRLLVRPGTGLIWTGAACMVGGIALASRKRRRRRDASELA
jgi:cytochrome c-type biogenesis protein CcmF